MKGGGRSYTEPTPYIDDGHYQECQKVKTEGVASLLEGNRIALEPEVLERRNRHNHSH